MVLNFTSSSYCFYFFNLSGITTGNCSEDEIDGVRTCQIISWCPVENEDKAITYVCMCPDND